MSYVVYVIEDEIEGSTLVKVGIAKDIDQRMRQYKTHNPRADLKYTMTLNGGEYEDAALVERMTFYMLASYRRDGEWFDATVRAARAAVDRATNLWSVLSGHRLTSLAFWYEDTLCDEDGPDLLYVKGKGDVAADEATIGDMRSYVAWLESLYAPFTDEIALRKRQLAELPVEQDDRRIFDVLRGETSNVIPLEKKA